jgi:hypothetical protein
MKTTKKIYGIALTLAYGLAVTLEAQNLYVATDGNGAYGAGTIGEYQLPGHRSMLR